MEKTPGRPSHPVPGERLYVDRHNDFSGEPEDSVRVSPDAPPSDPPITKIVVWACGVQNNGEAQLSWLVYRNRSALKEFTYFPSSTKGGGLVRPFYWNNDRDSGAEFPSLTSLTYLLSQAGFFSTSWWGWKTPALQHLTFLISEWDDPKDHQFGRWFDTSPAGTRFPELAEFVPSLEDVTFAFADSKDLEQRQIYPAWRLTRPTARWERIRLLFIARQKEDASYCPFAALPLDTVKVIAGLLCKWWLTIVPFDDPDRIALIKEKFGHDVNRLPDTWVPVPRRRAPPPQPASAGATTMS